MATTLELWNKVTAFPKGKWTFSRMLCLKAPYFGSISPLFTLYTIKIDNSLK